MTMSAKTMLRDAADDLMAPLCTDLFTDSAGVYWLSVDLMSALRCARVRHTEAGSFAIKILRAVQAQVGPNATILVSAFNFDFPHSGVFDVREAKVQTGVFGALLAEQFPESRVVHPFYSFMAFGEKANDLLSRQYLNSTGADSIFEWLILNNTSLISVGHHYVKSLTSVHHAEDSAGVVYRYRKSFFGTLIAEDGKKTDVTCTFLVRDVDECKHSALTEAGDKLFRKRGLIKTSFTGDRPLRLLAHRLDLAPAHDIMMDSFNGQRVQVVDYIRISGETAEVITPQRANELYLDELRASTAASTNR